MSGPLLPDIVREPKRGRMKYPTQHREGDEDLVKVTDGGVVPEGFARALSHCWAPQGACQEAEREAPGDGEEDVGYY
ncbi:hypothetical protein C7212DRAFT_313060, partial [Tuber magnatum]